MIHIFTHLLAEGGIEQIINFLCFSFLIFVMNYRT